MSEEIRSTYKPTKERMQLIRNKRLQLVGGLAIVAASIIAGFSVNDRVQEHDALLQQYAEAPIGSARSAELGDKLQTEITTFPLEVSLVGGAALVAGAAGIAMSVEATKRLQLVGGFQRQS